jgi:hypothetical protein
MVVYACNPNHLEGSGKKILRPMTAWATGQPPVLKKLKTEKMILS